MAALPGARSVGSGSVVASLTAGRVGPRSGEENPSANAEHVARVSPGGSPRTASGRSCAASTGSARWCRAPAGRRGGGGRRRSAAASRWSTTSSRRAPSTRIGWPRRSDGRCRPRARPRRPRCRWPGPAFSAHRIGGCGRVADEEHPSVGEHQVLDPGGDGPPCPMHAVPPGRVRAEQLADVRSGEQKGPEPGSFISRVAIRPPRRMPNPTLAWPSPTGNDQR